MFNIMGEEGLELKVFIWGPFTLKGGAKLACERWHVSNEEKIIKKKYYFEYEIEYKWFENLGFYKYVGYHKYWSGPYYHGC